MDRDANTERGPGLPIGSLERALRLDRSEHCVGDRRERGAQPVAGVLELDPPVTREGFTQHRVVTLDRPDHPRARRPRTGRALDVGEQEDDRLHPGGL